MSLFGYLQGWKGIPLPSHTLLFSGKTSCDHSAGPKEPSHRKGTDFVSPGDRNEQITWFGQWLKSTFQFRNANFTAFCTGPSGYCRTWKLNKPEGLRRSLACQGQGGGRNPRWVWVWQNEPAPVLSPAAEWRAKCIQLVVGWFAHHSNTCKFMDMLFSGGGESLNLLSGNQNISLNCLTCEIFMREWRLVTFPTGFQSYILPFQL